MPGCMKPGKDANFIFNGAADLLELKDIDLNGAHLHFNGPFDMRDLLTVDLRNTTIVINDYGGIPPCSNCGKSLLTNEAQQQSEVIFAASFVTQASTDREVEASPRPAKRLRTSGPIEDGEIQPSSSAGDLSVKPSGSEIHPERMRMLRDSSPETTPPPIKPISRTKSNLLDMPFNRLEDCNLQDTTADMSKGRGVKPVVRKMPRLGTESAKASSMTILRDRYLDAKDNEDKVDTFLLQLEQVVSDLPQQSDSYGRLSPP